MSFRSFLYEDFDLGSHASIGSSVNGAAGAPEARLHREIDIVRREGFEAGRAQGFAEGRQAALEEAEVRLAHDLPDLLVNLGGAAAELHQVKLACERDALRLTRAALCQMLPIVAERGLAQEAAALVAEAVANVPAPVVELRACPKASAAIQQRCDPLPSGVTLVTDPELPEGSVRCAWTNGEARFDGAAVKDAILAILDRCLERIDHAWAPSLAPAPEPPQKED